MSHSNRSSLRLNLNSNEFENRKSNQIKNISKQNLINLKFFLNQKPEFIDSKLSLKQQSWYHGQISRSDAEKLLKNCQVGSFLVRNSEFNKIDYSVSLKSVKGYIHIKIEKLEDNSFSLGINHLPFSSVPELIKNYSQNPLPIRGLDYLTLLFPIHDQLL